VTEGSSTVALSSMAARVISFTQEMLQHLQSSSSQLVQSKLNNHIYIILTSLFFSLWSRDSSG